MHTNRNTLRIYWRQIKNHLPTFIISLITIPLSVLLIDTGLPYFLSLAIGELAAGNNDKISHLLMLAAIVGLTGVVLNFIGFQSLVRQESRVRSRLYKYVFGSILHKDLQFFVNEKLGALTSRFIDFNRAHISLQDLLILRTLGFLLSVVTGLIIVSQSAPILAAVLFGLIVLVLIQVKIFTKIRAPYRHKRKKLVGEIHGEVADSLTNSLIVKTFGNERHEEKSLAKQMSIMDKIYTKDLSLFGTDGALRNATMVITQVIAISICTSLIVNGSLDIALAIFALTYLQRISSQIFSLGEILNGYDEALLQAAPMSDILQREVFVNDSPDAIDHVIKTPSINLQETSYRYNDRDKDVLHKINLDIPAGQKVGLVGRSGAGKTTITNLLLRFADVTHGEISIDGVDIRDMKQESLRRQIAYVPQESMLFHRSLRENIAYGKLDATDEEILDAARQANALDFIEKLPEGLDTMVGERGVKLSGGQRQRIAIARAILKDAPILILDEATSALDSESEILIQASLEKLMQGRTSLVIAHRLSTIAKLDRIIVLDNGKIIEDGSHEHLLTKKGTYAKLWAHQSGGFIEE